MTLKEFFFRDSHGSEPREPHPIYDSLVTRLIPTRHRNRIAMAAMDDYPRYKEALELPNLSAMEAGTTEQMENKMRELERSLTGLIIALAFCVLGALHGIVMLHPVTFIIFAAVGVLLPGRKLASNIVQQCIIIYLYDLRSWQRPR